MISGKILDSKIFHEQSRTNENCHAANLWLDHPGNTDLIMRLAMLFFLVALSAVGQPDVAPGNPSRSATNLQVEVSPMQTNQPSSVIQLAENIRADCIKGRRSIYGRILRVLPEGIIVESGYTNLLREPLSQSWLVPGTVTASRASNLIENNEPDSLCAGQVLLTDLPKLRGAKPQQYDYVILCGYPTGQATYTSVGDVQKTVRRFSASLDKAVKLNFAAVEKRPSAHPAGAK